MKAIIIGGGISGLCTGYRLKQKGVDVMIFEKNSIPGGLIQTEFNEGFLLEYGPNSIFTSSPEVNNLINDLNLKDKILYANPSSKKRYILKKGNLIPVPTKSLEFISTDLFSFSAKLRILKEPFVKVDKHEDESISEFVNRRLGKEVLNYLINPFIAGVYAGNPEELSMRSSFPKLYELEKEYGGLIKGLFKSRKEKSKTETISLKEGMQTLIDELYGNLYDNVKLNSPVERILINDRSFDKKFTVRISTGSKVYNEDADAVIISSSANVSAGLIKSIDAKLAEELFRIDYVPISIVYLGYKKEDIKFNIDGFGFLIPEIEKRNILGCLWNSEIFNDRASEKMHLFTIFTGGSRQPAIAKKNDNELLGIVKDELNSIIGIRGEPEFQKIVRWELAIPQYKLGYFKLIQKIDKFKNENRGIFFCNNFYRGISVSDCIENANKTSNEVIEYFN